MPRLPRIDFPGLNYHVMSRGVRQLAIFQDDQDRQMFLRFLLQTQEIFPFTLHAYCLMSNHFHLLIQTIEASLASVMRHVKRQFSAWLNLKYERKGHSFQGRFHSIPVETDTYFTTVSRYIHLNPVRAGIVKQPEEYAWSNYGRLIRLERDPLVKNDFLLGFFGETLDQQVAHYKRFVEEGLNKPELISDETLYRLRSWGAMPVLRPGVAPMSPSRK